MTWFGWIFVGWYAVSSLLVIGSIGKPRQPTHPATAVLMVVVAALMITGVLTIGTGSGF